MPAGFGRRAPLLPSTPHASRLAKLTPTPSLGSRRLRIGEGYISGYALRFFGAAGAGRRLLLLLPRAH
ncbi:MAG: hypothetical protein WKG07_32460 [Hymenobacter sp.]